MEIAPRLLVESHIDMSNAPAGRIVRTTFKGHVNLDEHNSLETVCTSKICIKSLVFSKRGFCNSR